MPDEATLDEDYFAPLCMAVGGMMLHAAFVEQLLDMNIAIIYQAGRGKSIMRELPRQTIAKIKFHRSAYGQIPRLSDHKKEIERLMIEAERIFAKRNFIAHGALSGRNAQAKSVTFTRLELIEKEKIHKAVTLEFSISDINKIADDANILSRELAAIHEILHKEFAD